MRIIGVIDIRNGRAVHARGGRRESYEPIDVAAGERVGGDAVALARVYVETLGTSELYVADLDAIATGSPAANAALVGRIAALGAPIWLDAGVTTPAGANAAGDAGASVVVVGLETLASFDALDEICSAVGGERVAFSIDLRDRQPITLPNVDHSMYSVSDLARRAVDAGVGSLIVLDLARVGTETGVDVELLSIVRRTGPDVALFAGGGVRDASDLERLNAAGCDGALVATALLSGALRLPRADTSPTGRSSPPPRSRSR